MTTEIELLIPYSPRPPPPHSRMYTGASFITTQTYVVCISPWDWRIISLSVYDIRDIASESTPWSCSPSSLMNVHRRCIGYLNPNCHSLTVPPPLLVFDLSVVINWTNSHVKIQWDYPCFDRETLHERCVDPSGLVFSLSSHLHPSIPKPCVRQFFLSSSFRLECLKRLISLYGRTSVCVCVWPIPPFDIFPLSVTLSVEINNNPVKKTESCLFPRGVTIGHGLPPRWGKQGDKSSVHIPHHTYILYTHVTLSWVPLSHCVFPDFYQEFFSR